ncbi:MAG: hypothetical protein BGN85_06720 [Alphaproteobacteria bacterium 64-11]|nr:carboxylesterase family protein [Alphaproteobacteria bacterium]OJU11785.1 MAG: hypothetical protein BGN85_06720 [Alphaproteobacteria bacterium 64-11]
MARWKLLACCSALIAALAVQADAGEMIPIPGDPVTIENGRVSGTLLDNGVKAYLGVPFATPPVRELRWKTPEAKKPWKGIWNADTRLTNCYIPLRATTLNHYFGEIRSSEDCLYANVWAPPTAKAGDGLPVVVWIHGGGFQEGSINFQVYYGQALAKKGVVFAAIDYRVNVFGNMAHPELSAESGHKASGNYGLMDLIAGLRWLKRNAAAFGGDPDNVTVLGQSAGAMALDLLASSPIAKECVEIPGRPGCHKLFDKIIALSGGYHGVAAPHLETLTETEAKGVALQRAMMAKDIAAMRTRPADEVYEVAKTNHITFSGPTLDNYVLTETPAQTFAAGRQIDVPMLLSSVGNDIGSKTAVTSATTLADYQQAAHSLYGADADAFLKLFPAKTDAEAVHQAKAVARISGFGIEARDWAKAQAEHGKAPVWLVQYNHPHPYPPGVVITDMDVKTAGAYHNSDLPFWFGTLDSLNLYRHIRDWTPYDYKLSDMMQDVVVAFARTGNPATAAAPIPRYSPRKEQRLVFGDKGVTVEALDERQLDFIESHPARRN